MSSASVLIVDDQKINRRLLSAILGNQGLELRQAASGEEALRHAAEATPDIVLLDVMMPGKNGFEVCEELLGNPATESVPIIFLTALDDTKDKVRGLNLGAADYITKPFRRAEVLARVNTQIRLRQLTRNLRQKNRELEEKQNRLEDDLRAAAQIQEALIPPETIQVPGLDLAWRFQPCDAIGGDIFNVLDLGKGRLALYLLDVSGHGVPSALVTVSAAQSFAGRTGIVSRALPGGEVEVFEPQEVLRRLDREYPIDRFGKYFTISYLLLDTQRGFLSYSAAAHPPSILQRTDGEIVLLEEGGPIIGMGSYLDFEQGEERLAPGDRLFLYSDGILEQRGGDELFGKERLLRALEEGRDRSLDQACELVLAALDGFRDGLPTDDDISIFAAELRASPEDASASERPGGGW